MASRLLALASVTALSGLVAAASATGCASESKDKAQATSSTDPPDSGAAPVDSGPAGQPDGGEPPPPACMVTDPIDATKYPYKKAGVAKDACTQAELDELTKFFGDHAKDGFKVADWEASVSAKCAKCAFSDGSAATWTPILTKGDELDTVNRGGCVEVMSGNEACGRSYQQITDCLVDACYTKCKTAEEYFGCLKDTPSVFNGPCKVAYDAMTKDCGDDLGKYEEACASKTFTFEGPVKVMCIDGGKAAGGG